MDKYVYINRDRDLVGAVAGDGRNCVIARGAGNLPRVVEAYIGSRGRAHILYERKGFTYALEYAVAAKAGRVIDYFDFHKDCQTQTVTFKALSPSQTKAGRRELTAIRRERLEQEAKATIRGANPDREPESASPKQGKAQFTQTHTTVNPPTPKTSAKPSAKKLPVKKKNKIKEQRFGVPHRENPPAYAYDVATVLDPDLPNWGEAGQ